MSTTTAAKAVPRPRPRPPGQRPQRLDSFSNPQPRPPPGARKKEALKCPDPTCKGDEIGDEDGKKICMVCGAVVSEFHMVTDVQYGLTSSGQHVVHGAHVSADQAYNRNGMIFDRNKQTTSEEVTNLAGRRYMGIVQEQLRVELRLVDAGMQVFRLASGNNFIQGRRTKSVAAVCLYLACRAQRDTPNPHMLIDFADVLNLDVFGLGQIYKGLIKVIRINDHNFYVPPINPEDLIYRFTARMEFDTKHMQVAKDATRIVQRMSRDWMTHGRRPAGICGAAIILAARMNDFRRTVREVVYVVKVQEQTIQKRLDEFKVTESGNLTVEQFRDVFLEREAEPPAFYEQHAEKKKRGRKRKEPQFDDDEDGGLPIEAASRTASVTATTSSRAAPTVLTRSKVAQMETPASTQYNLSDSQSMPPPPLPIDPNLLEAAKQATATDVNDSHNGPTPEYLQAATASKGKGKAKAAPKRPPARAKKTPTSQPLDETQLLFTLTDPLNVDSTVDRTIDPDSDLPPTPSATQIAAETSVETSAAPRSMPPRKPIPSTPEIDDDEFASDPEVANCLLTPAERAFKTRIWTSENADWLRATSAKAHKAALAEANGTARIIKRRTRRRGRVGDMTKYGIGVEGGREPGEPVAQTPEQAVRMMMNKRGFSKKLNYDLIEDTYGGRKDRSRGTSVGAGSPGSGVAGSPGAAMSPGGVGTQSPNVVHDAGPSSERRSGEMESAEVDEDDVVEEDGTFDPERQRQTQQEIEELSSDEEEEEEGEEYEEDEDEG